MYVLLLFHGSCVSCMLRITSVADRTDGFNLMENSEPINPVTQDCIIITIVHFSLSIYSVVFEDSI